MTKRIYKTLKRNKGISQIIYRDEVTGKQTHKGYSAKRLVVDPAKGKRRVQKHFQSLAEAQDFMIGNYTQRDEGDFSELFGEVLDNFLDPSCGKEESTLIRYRSLAKNYLDGFRKLRIREITASQIDEWIAWLKSPESGFVTASRRKTFKHEMDLLSAVFNFYQEHDDSLTFRSPVKKRHRKAVRLNHVGERKNKSLAVEEFERFLVALRQRNHGDVLGDLAIVQYYHALRVSEAAAISWENVRLNLKEPKLSRLIIGQSLSYLREKSATPTVREKFKNSRHLGGAKEHPMFPQSFEVFSRLHNPWGRGFVFLIEGKPIKYRTIQYHYGKAFEAAGLDRSGTHVLRHGGCQEVFNLTGDLSIAQQHLGNTDLKTTQVYARRSASALTEVAHKMWDNWRGLVANGGS